MDDYTMRPIVKQCTGCPYIDALHTALEPICQSYRFPESKWSDGRSCPRKPKEKPDEFFLDNNHF